MTEIIVLSPNQDIGGYSTFVRLNETEKNAWVKIPKSANAIPVKSQAYDLFPGEIRFLDLSVPNAKNKPKAELRIQLYLEAAEEMPFLNSPAFSLEATQ